MSEAKLSQKADLALSDLTSNGGILNPEQNDQFVRVLMDSPTIIRDMRVVPMNAPTMKINKIGFGSRILLAANNSSTQNGGPYQGAQDNGTNPRYVAAASRAKPQLSQIQLNTSEVIAEIRIPYEVLEDNIERGNMADTILAMVAERAALDLEEWVIKADTSLSGSDAYLGLQDGLLKKATTHVVDNANAVIDVTTFNNMKKALPTKYRRNLQALRFYFSMDQESDYRVKVASRGTGLGDATLTGNAPLPVLGVNLVGVALMPESNGILTNPQNLILGIQRNLRIEQDRDIRSREVIIVLTARIAFNIEETDALVKLQNLG